MLKSFAHRVMSWLPSSRAMGEFVRERISKSLDLPSGKFETKVAECHRQMQHFRRAAGRELQGARVVEIGTGWYPVMPICYFLCGAGSVWTFDIEPLLRPHRVRRTFELFVEAENSGRLSDLLPRLNPARMKMLRDALGSPAAAPTKSLLEPLGIHAVVQDAQRTGLDSESVTLITSSGVLEYIPRGSISGVFKELARIAAPGATMVHRINLTDQYSYFDPTISPFHYLKYSEAMWKRFDSPLVSQNRLRIAEYRDLVRASGFEIVNEENESGASSDFDRVSLAPEFRRFSREDLLVLHSWLIARRISAT